MRCALQCGAIVAEALDQPPRQGLSSAIEFMQRMARSRTAALGPLQVRQEALAIELLRSQAGLRAGRDP